MARTAFRRGKVARLQASATPRDSASQADHRSSSEPCKIRCRSGARRPSRCARSRSARRAPRGRAASTPTRPRAASRPSFDVAASESLTDEQKRRIIARLGPRVVAVAQDARSQSRNRELALERLARRLASALTVRTPAPRHPPHAALGRPAPGLQAPPVRAQARPPPPRRRLIASEALSSPFAVCSVARVRWYIDGMNVIGSRPDGWWRDRDGPCSGSSTCSSAGRRPRARTSSLSSSDRQGRRSARP